MRLQKSRVHHRRDVLAPGFADAMLDGLKKADGIGRLPESLASRAALVMSRADKPFQNHSKALNPTAPRLLIEEA